MDSKAKFLGHSIHQILIVFPLGLLGTSAAFEIAYLATREPNMATVTFWLMVAGIIGGVVAAPFGWIDWFAIPWRTRAKSVGLTHGLLNVAVLTLFAANVWLRWREPHVPGGIAIALTFIGVGLAVLGGWLGGELVSRLGVAVHDGAHLNAPNSLSGRPASESVEPSTPG